MAESLQKKVRPRKIRGLKAAVCFVLSGLFLLLFSGCQGERKPFETLTAEQLSELQVVFLMNDPEKYIVLNDQEKKKMVEALNALTTTGKNDEFYYGTCWGLLLKYTDGSQVEIGESGYDRVIIGGEGYYWTQESCDRLNKLCNELYAKYVENNPS